MKLEFKTNYLQYLSSKNGYQRFSWVDLLRVIIILGILTAIALPSRLSDTLRPNQQH